MNSMAGRIPLLNGSNYGTWKAQMEAVLHKNRLLNIVLGEEKAPRVRKLPEDPTAEQKREFEQEMNNAQKYIDKDMDARAEILMAIETNIVTMVKNMKSSKDVWLYLQETFDRKSIRKKIECYRKLLNMKMSDNQSISQFSIDFDVCVSCIYEMGIEIDEDLLVVIMLDALPDRFSAVKAAVDTANEFPKIAVLKSKLLEIGDKEENDASNSAFKAKFHKNKYQNQPNKYKNQEEGRFKNKFDYKCFRCGRKGHKAKDCRTSENARRVEQEIKDNISNEVLVTMIETTFCTSSRETWIIDSGASSHMCTQISLFENIDAQFSGKVRLANENELNIKGIGKVKVPVYVNGKKQDISLCNTLYVPDLRCNLISTSKLTDNGCTVFMKGTEVVVYKGEDKIIQGHKRDNLYFVKLFENIMHTTDKFNDFKTEIWHKRYGHLNLNQLRKLHIDDMVKGLPELKNVGINCVSCIRAKQTCLPFPRKNKKSTSEVLALIHTDLCGPMRTESLGGSLYFATFIDDYSRKVFLYFIRHKSQYLEKFKEFKKMAETQTGKKIKILRSDNGAELVSQEFTNFLKDNGIKRQLTASYTPQQNGIAERMNRTLVEMARCFMIESGLPMSLWTELINTSGYIRNRCPTKLNGTKTPEELWTGKKPDVKYFRRIGCISFVLNKTTKRSKWDPRSNEYILVGYSDESKAYRLWKAGTKQIVTSRDVKFIENSMYNNNENNNNMSFYEFVSNDIIRDQSDKIIDDPKTSNTIEQESNKQYTNEESEQEVQKQSSNNKKEQNRENDSIKNRLRNRKNQEKTQIAKENIIDPKTVSEAMSSDCSKDWVEAMEDEYKSLIKNNTWCLTNLPNGRKAIGCKWVFKSKIRPDGTIEKRKARLVAKGYSQKFGLDYVDTFAPVVRQTSLRLLYALAVEHDLQLRQLDVSTAFLNGNLEEEIYMEQPEGFIQETTREKVCKLNKAIYGLKQAGRQWFKRIDSVIKDFGLQQSKYDQCIYFIRKHGKIMIVALYVDDIIIAANNMNFIEDFASRLKDNFDIRDLGVPKHCIGLEVNVKKGEISISQPGYISNLIKKYGLENCKPSKIPMDPGIKLEKEPTISGEADKVDEKFYQEIIGSLLYLSLYSRPDITCAVNMLSQFSKDPRKQHLNSAYHIIRYLNYTKNAVLTYRKCGLPLTGFCDANWAQDVNDRKSQSGFCFLLAGGLVSWESKKQKVVATSSAEAEYVALTEATKEASYLEYILDELGYSNNSPVMINTDSQSAQRMAEFGAHHSRTKHIHYKYHYVKDAIEQNIIKLQYLSTDKMLADVLTKPVPKPKHIFCCNNFGIVF